MRNYMTDTQRDDMLAAVFEEGQEAREDGEKRRSPYRDRSNLDSEWLAGWDAADRVQRELDAEESSLLSVLAPKSGEER